MKVRFWGVRGSIPSPGKNTARYGGNTSCIEIETDGGQSIILDAGSGIREFANNYLTRKKPLNFHIFFTHTHWDHIQGFPFFIPIFIPVSSIKMFAPDPLDDKLQNLESIMKNQMSYQVFPVSLQAIQNMNSKIEYYDIKEGPVNSELIKSLSDEGIKITAQYMKHPVTCLGYKIEQNGKTVVYTGDNEPYYNIFDKNLDINKNKNKESSILFDDDIEEDVDDNEAEKAADDLNNKFLNFVKDCNVLIADSQYTDEEYKTKMDWGHSPIEGNIDKAAAANVKKLILFHHDPMRTDEQIDELLLNFRKKLLEQGKSLELYAAKEKWEIEI